MKQAPVKSIHYNSNNIRYIFQLSNIFLIVIFSQLFQTNLSVLLTISSDIIVHYYFIYAAYLLTVSSDIINIVHYYFTYAAYLLTISSDIVSTSFITTSHMLLTYLQYLLIL